MRTKQPHPKRFVRFGPAVVALGAAVPPEGYPEFRDSIKRRFGAAGRVAVLGTAVALDGREDLVFALEQRDLEAFAARQREWGTGMRWLVDLFDGTYADDELRDVLIRTLGVTGPGVDGRGVSVDGVASVA